MGKEERARSGRGAGEERAKSGRGAGEERARSGRRAQRAGSAAGKERIDLRKGRQGGSVVEQLLTAFRNGVRALAWQSDGAVVLQSGISGAARHQGA